MSLEMNKIAASVLTAGVVALGTSFIAGVLVHPHVPEEPHYAVAVQTAEGDGQEQAPQGPQPILPLLAEADAAAGEAATRACQACHSFDKGGPAKVGPNLYGVVGEEIAGVEGFGYSPALAEKEGSWTYENLNAFLHDPQGWAQGTNMTYNGVKDRQKRADIVAYLRQNDDSPEPLPSEAEVAAVTGDGEGGADEAAEGETAEDEAAAEDTAGDAETGGEAGEGGDGQADAAGDGVAARIAAGDAEAGEAAARACQACHSFEEGGPHKVGPNLYDVVGSDIAAADGFTYSSALQGKEGAWTYENLWAFLADPQGWAQGTRMTYPGVKDPEKRADLIAYLRRQSSDPPPLD